MDIKEQVKKWVENKVEEVINKDLKEKILDENSSFNVETYVSSLLDNYFNETDIEELKESLNIDTYCDVLYLESENSTERNSLLDSLESESNESKSFPVEEIISNLENDLEVQKKYLQILDASAEDLINQSSWNKNKEILQNILNRNGDEEMKMMVIKVFQKLLKFSKKPETICKGFTSIAEVVNNQINLFNLENESILIEEVWDLKQDEWFCEKTPSGFGNVKFSTVKHQKSIRAEILIKLMWILIDCQQQVLIKWMHSNKARFREIIFSFVHLLSSTSTSENTKLSGLELLSVLSPRASWCRYWCHTAVGRSLLCSAFRQYKNFFIQIIEIILGHMKIKKANSLPPVIDSINPNKYSPKFNNDITETLKHKKNAGSLNQTERENTRSRKKYSNERKNYVRSAPGEHLAGNTMKHETLKKPKNTSSQWIIENIPKRVVNEAVFFHSVSFVSCLIQFRSGRALFPVQIATRKRLLSVQDLSLSIIEYLENTDYKWGNPEITFTAAYHAKVLEMLDILKKVKSHINSSTVRTERQKFCHV